MASRMHSGGQPPTGRCIDLVQPDGAAGALAPSIMKKRSADPAPQEPLGIIISRGSREEHPPRFAAYVWGPAPEADLKDLAAA